MSNVCVEVARELSQVKIDSRLLLDDTAFAEHMLEKEKLDYADIVLLFRNLLKLKYYPVAIKFFFDEELRKFKEKGNYKVSSKPLTFCHYSSASRLKGEVLVGSKNKLGCSNARYVFGWKEFDEREIKTHLKYAKDKEQAEKFVKSKTRLNKPLIAFATAPLHKAAFKPDVIHIICDVLQSYHIYNDYASAFGIHPIRPIFMINSAACGGAVWSYNNHMINIVPMCSGSYTSGKTEQGEINVFIPGEQIEEVAKRLLERTRQYGGASFPRTGETYPGYDVCKLCPLLTFREEGKVEE
ncbi:MAG TPA: hypothetical protein EYP30_02525 [Archaeoglobaceae archaeon]|nr:hypothetical protein [Archaeoglobaceae archaeon]